MTLSVFDPICFGQYPKGEQPKVLHFQYEGSEDVFRYILVERIPITEINAATRRKAGEGEDVRDKYIKPPPKEWIETKPVQPEEIAQDPPPVEKKVEKKKAKKRRNYGNSR